MSEYRIQVGKPETPKAVEKFKELEERLKDDSKKKVQMVLAGILFIALLGGVYLLFSGGPENLTDGTVSSNGNGEETDEYVQNHKTFTAGTIRSLSRPLEGDKTRISGPPSFDDGNSYGNMEVLKTAESSQQDTRPEFVLPERALLNAHIDGKVVATSLQWPVEAIVDEDFEQEGKILISEGTRLFGYTTGIQGQNRVLIQFRGLKLPGDKTAYAFSGVAVDQNKSMGIEGEVDREAVYNTGRSLATTVLGAGMDQAFAENQSVFGEVAGRTIQNTTQDLSSMMAQNGGRTDSEVTVTLPPYAEIKVLVMRNF